MPIRCPGDFFFMIQDIINEIGKLSKSDSKLCNMLNFLVLEKLTLSFSYDHCKR